jgi:hypothetical protein
MKMVWKCHPTIKEWVFILFDPRLAWRLELAKEMRAVGLPVNLNKAV